MPLVYGGPWPTVSQKLTLSNPNVDYIVVGAADETVIQLTNYFLGVKKELPEGVYSKKHLKVIDDSPSNFRQIIPIKSSYWRESYELIPDLDLYRSPRNVTSLFAATSCPYGRCKFCSIMQPYKYFMRERKDILDEISFLINDKKFDSITFLDGLFFSNRTKTVELIKGFL